MKSVEPETVSELCRKQGHECDVSMQMDCNKSEPSERGLSLSPGKVTLHRNGRLNLGVF